MNPTRKTKKHYVNNADFVVALNEYKEKLKANPNARITDYIGICISAICNKMATRPNFSGYTFKDEMIGDAIENCLEAVNNFDPEKSIARSRTSTVNAFGYFSWIAWNAFIRRIAKEKKQTYIKYKNMQNLHIFDEFTSVIIYDNEATNQIIENFESRLTKPKKNGIVGIEKFVEND
jgi:hypothetical protein